MPFDLHDDLFYEENSHTLIHGIIFDKAIPSDLHELLSLQQNSRLLKRKEWNMVTLSELWKSVFLFIVLVKCKILTIGRCKRFMNKGQKKDDNILMIISKPIYSNLTHLKLRIFT